MGECEGAKPPHEDRAVGAGITGAICAVPM